MIQDANFYKTEGISVIHHFNFLMFAPTLIKITIFKIEYPIVHMNWKKAKTGPHLKQAPYFVYLPVIFLMNLLLHFKFHEILKTSK